MNSTFWKGKHVLVTGHTGFKGSWLSLWLQKLGANLVGFSNSIPTNPSLFELANVDDKMTSVMKDIRDYDAILNTLNEFQPEIVIHMAAQSLVRKSYENPLDTYSTNIMGTVNLLESLRYQSSVRAIINVTSDKCYDNTDSTIEHKEDDPMGGFDPYSSSKGCAELITSSFRNSFFTSGSSTESTSLLASVRAGNVIGGGDWAQDRLIPSIFEGMLHNHQIEIRNPHAIRPWQFVLDPLYGYLMLAEKLWNTNLKFATSWNFGPSNENVKPVSWIVDKLNSFLNGDFTWKNIENDNNPHEEQYLKLDSSKARNELSWMPKVDLITGLKFTAEWYEQYRLENNLHEFTIQQIDTYEKLL